MFIDIHGHVYRRPGAPHAGRQWFSTPEQLLVRYKELDIDQAVLLPLVNPEFYLPQSVEEILDICDEFPGRFIPFCNIDPRAWNNTPTSPLDELFTYYKQRGCKGIGEVMPNLWFLDPLVQNLFRHAQNAGFPLIFDINTRVGHGAYGLADEAGLPQLEMCLRHYPKLNILGHGPAFWAEISRLETPADRHGYPSYPLRGEGVVPTLLRRYPNMWGDLSAGSGYNALARDPDYAVKFLNEFQDKLLFGTDICGPQDAVRLPEFLRSLLRAGKISETVFKKIAHGNAIRLLGL